MHTRGLHDRKGELFAYLEGLTLYTLEGEMTGRIEGDYIVDTGGNRIWRVFKHGVYTLDGMEPVGYFGSKATDE